MHTFNTYRVSWKISFWECLYFSPVLCDAEDQTQGLTYAK